MLRLFRARHDEAGRDVGDTDGRVRRVDVLAAGTRGTHGIDADVFGANLDVDLLGFRQHGNGCRRRVDASARLGFRHTLDAVHTGFEFQPRKHAAPGNGGNDFLEAAGFALAC
ncbi:hypothetical protein D9M72_649820 [compost metagenome]